MILSLLLDAAAPSGGITLTDITGALTQGGYVGILALIVVTGYKKVWVWGEQLEEAETRCTEWRELALSNMRSNERVLDIADTLKAAAQLPSRQPTRRRPTGR